MRLLHAGLAGLVAFAAAGSLPSQTAVPAGTLAPVLDSLHQDPNGATLTAADVTSGARTVGAKEHIAGSVATWKGPLEIHGTVDGNAVAIGGDVIVGKGGRVRGDVLSIGGAVRLDGGSVDGEMRTLSAFTLGPAVAKPLTPAMAMRHSVTLAVGWYLVLACVGLGILLVARAPLDAVAEALRTHPVRALGAGVLAQLAIAPAFVLLMVALAITIIGVVVIPFAVIGFFAALAGALALGFVAVVMITGGAITGDRNGDRAIVAALQPLLLGLTAFLVLWIAGNAFGWTGGLGAGLRIAAAAITWVALTAGFGAVIVTRAGTRAIPVAAQLSPAPTAEHEWQTPTPVSGVAAARRPTPAPRKSGGDR